MPHPQVMQEEEQLTIEQRILQAIKTVRYGSVEIVIHDAKVVQIERKEKIRLDDGNTVRRR